MLYKVGNSINEINQLLVNLRSTYPNYAFISYIDGEYGMRCLMYNTYVKEFCTLLTNQNTITIGICFLNTKVYLDGICDHIIEIQDTHFEHSSESYHSHQSSDAQNYVLETFTTNNDGWDLYYIKGLHNADYESMIGSMNFDSIFFTTHLDGSRLVNCQNWAFMDNRNAIVYRINNVLTTKNLNDITNSIIIPKQKKSFIKNNRITLCIRNTNKWPQRNMPLSIYSQVILYCIRNKIYVYVIQDLIPIDLPPSEYVIECNYRVNNLPNLDKYREIYNECCLFIGCCSGSINVPSMYCKNTVTVCIESDPHINTRSLNLDIALPANKSIVEFLNDYIG
jgi:hypothetical protein